MGERIRDSIWDKSGVIGGMLGSIPIPKMARIGQEFADERLTDIPGTIAGEFLKKEIRSAIKPGMSVAITAGSRGLSDFALIVKETVEQVRKLGGNPFIIPAMGSHGGATAEGQLDVLASYGITEATMGVPVKSSMETVIVGQTQEGKPVHIDKHASEADGIVVVGRVKPHTCFRGRYESGLVKMMAIGLGKQKGAESCHAEGFGKMAENIEAFADQIIAKTNILFGIAIVENAFDRTSRIEAIPTERIKQREGELLLEAKSLMPSIYLRNFDILIIDRIGKNISGDGADPNISGTYATPYASGGPEFQRYVVLDLTDETHGNANGIGMADFTTKRVFDKTDFDLTYPNGLTTTLVSTLSMPMVLRNDKSAMQAAIFSCNGIDKSRPRIVRLKNTAHVEEIMVSEALLEEVRAHPRLRILDEPKEPVFDQDGNLRPGENVWA